jgi:hypothetical protein
MFKTRVNTVDICLVCVAALPQAAFLFVGLYGAAVSLLWDSQSYFITALAFQDTFPYVPILNFRAFGYPAFLRIFFDNSNFDLPSIILAQKIITLASTTLVYVLARLVVELRAIAFGVTLVFAVDPQLALYANSIMTETLAIPLQLISLILIVVSLRQGASTRWIAAAAASLTLAIFVRPTFIAMVPVAVAVITWIILTNCGFTALAIKVAGFRALLIFTISVGPVVAYSAYNFKAFEGAGFSSLNYVCNPCMYQLLSNKLAYIREPLIKMQHNLAPEYGDPEFRDTFCAGWFLPEQRPNKLHWGIAFDALREAYQQHHQNFATEWDTMAMRIFTSAVADRPIEYTQIWSKVFFEFWTSYTLVFGLYGSVADIPGKSVITYSRMNSVVEIVGGAFSVLSLASLPVVLAALICSACLRSAFPKRDQAIVFLTFYTLAYSLLSISLESGSQARYRAILDPVIFLSAAYVLDRLRSAVRMRHLGNDRTSW